jgi:riboflavin synthase
MAKNRNLNPMFTGIIEAIGTVKEVSHAGTNSSFWIESPISLELKADQSVSHNGVCLTVEKSDEKGHQVTAIKETLKKTNLGSLNIGDLVNLERSMLLNSRFDGHIVQGHTDSTALCTARKDLNGSWEFRFEFPKAFTRLVIEKGSICLNGISLTIFSLKKNRFSVAIIPYTLEHTNIHKIDVGSRVNLEYDIVGKYLLKAVK